MHILENWPLRRAAPCHLFQRKIKVMNLEKHQHNSPFMKMINT